MSQASEGFFFICLTMLSINDHCFSTVNTFWTGWNRSEHHASVPQEAPGSLENTESHLSPPGIRNLSSTLDTWAAVFRPAAELGKVWSTDKSKRHKAFPPLSGLFLVERPLVCHPALSVPECWQAGANSLCCFFTCLWRSVVWEQPTLPFSWYHSVFLFLKI